MAVGFSDYGCVAGADLCAIWRDWRGNTFFSDTHVTEVRFENVIDCKIFGYQNFSFYTPQVSKCFVVFLHVLKQGRTEKLNRGGANIDNNEVFL